MRIAIERKTTAHTADRLQKARLHQVVLNAARERYGMSSFSATSAIEI